MKDYLESLIIEQINRALALKDIISGPLKYSELTGLVERCRYVLNEQIQILNALASEIVNRDENDLRDLFREMRACARHIALVEYYGVPALYYQPPEAAFLNKLVFKIQQEIELPIPPPAVCCIHTEYYCSVFFTNVIFAPIGESRFLLHLPDLYHEIGHCVAESMDSELRLKSLKESYTSAFSKITSFYNELLKAKRREASPPNILLAIGKFHSQWKLWLNEFFCDLFAVYTLGPAYAWSHLHLATKRTDDIYELPLLEKQTHPSDEARMRILIYGLRNMGFDEQAEQISSRWSEVVKFWGDPQPEYLYAYPNDLLNEIAKLVLEGLIQSGFSIVSRETLASDDNNEIRALLNQAWREFWTRRPRDFRDWEEKCLANLRSSLK